MADVGGIKAVHLAGWRQGYGSLLESALIEREIETRCNRWRALLNALPPGHDISVVEHESRVVAFSHCSPDGDHRDSIELKSFYVHPDLWGTGTSSMLISHVLSLTAERGCRAVYLTAFDKSARARSFYKKAGFEETGRTIESKMLDDSTVVNVEYVYRFR